MTVSSTAAFLSPAPHHQCYPPPSAAAYRFLSSSTLKSSPEEDESGDGNDGGYDKSLSSARAAAAASASSSSDFDPNTSFLPPGFDLDDVSGSGGGSVGAAASAAAKRFESRPDDYEYVPTEETFGSEKEGRRTQRRRGDDRVPRGGRSRGRPDTDFEDDSGRERRTRGGRRGGTGKGDGWEKSDDGGSGGDGKSGGGKSFREDFQGTRVFVQGIPDHVEWQQLKDHFGVAGSVVFASVSVDFRTGQSKGCGVVQYETTEEAREAIKVMRDHPLDGETLYVREDVQEKRRGGGMAAGGGRGRTMREQGGGGRRGGGRGPPDEWRCADELRAEEILSSPQEREAVLTLVEARDAARRRRDYELSDALRDQLKLDHDVHVDDTLKLWWVSEDGGVPATVAELKGEGRWGRAKPWRRIPTTPEMDDLVPDPDRVEYLLKQRDEARRRKDYARADTLLEEARASPDGDVELKIHDESRTWRVWTVEKPPPPPGSPPRKTKEELREDAAREALELVRTRSPHKLVEVETLLAKFPGKEFNILRKLKQRFNDERNSE